MNLRIEKPIYGGAGLARSEGKAIFVPYTLPGELVEARILHDHGSYANALLDNINEPSPQRVQALCAYFGQCGGCHYQHAGYDLQVAMKTQILRETLQRAHIADIPEISAIHAEPFGYRNRIRLHIDRLTSQLCFKRGSSHQNLPADSCSIAAPALQQALGTLQAASQSWQLGASFSELEMFTNAAQDSILMTLSTAGPSRSAVQKLSELWPSMQAQVGGLAGAAIFSTDNGQSAIRHLARIGEQSFTYAADGRDYRVTLGSFFQINRYLIDLLVQSVAHEASGSLAWDLYAGVGLFAASTASRFDQVVAVESVSTSASDLRQNLSGKQHKAVVDSALNFLRRAVVSKQKAPDLVIVDPPRAGLGKEVVTLLAAIRPAHITYVSCDPATLSRDLKSLLDSGYHLSSMRMVDLFPQTFHLESVATLSLK